MEAEQSGTTLPKTMPLETLAVKLPSIIELNALWDLQRFAKSIECLIISDELTIPRDMRDKGSDRLPEDRDRMVEWRTGLYKAIYRSLIAGAALAGIYQEPFHAIKERGKPEEWSAQSVVYGFSETQKDFVQGYTVLQTVTTLEQDTATFAFLAQWLLKNIVSDIECRDAMAHRFHHKYGRATTCSGDQDCPLMFDEGSHADAHLIVWDLMKMFWITEYLCDSVMEGGINLVGNDTSFPKGRAPIVLFRYFSPMSIIGPSLTTSYRTTEVGNGVDDLLQKVLRKSGQPNNYEDGSLLAPLHLKFFEHFLCRHVNMRFHISFFDWEMDLDNWDSFISLSRTLGLFALDDVKGRLGEPETDNVNSVDFLGGSEILESTELPLDRCFRRL